MREDWMDELSIEQMMMLTGTFTEQDAIAQWDEMFGDDDTTGGSKVPAKPKSPSPIFSGGVALALPI